MPSTAPKEAADDGAGEEHDEGPAAGDVARPVAALPGLTAAFMAQVRREIQGWLDRPLVWRDDGQTVQAVLMGVFRYTWSRARPEGLLETFDLDEGWRTVERQDSVVLSFSAPGRIDTVLYPYHALLTPLLAPTVLQNHHAHALMFRGGLVHAMVNAVLQHTARATQRASGGRRLTLWVGDVGTNGRFTSWLPVAGPFSRSLPPELGDALPAVVQHAWNDPRAAALVPVWARIHLELKRLVRVLSTRSTLWSSVRRQAAWPATAMTMYGVQAMFRRMTEWEARRTEHPNAGLLMPLLDGLSRVPNVHLWREDTWVPTVFPTPHSWRFALRQGPMVNVRTLLHHVFDENQQGRPQTQSLVTLSEIPDAHRPLPTVVMRAVPSDLWWDRGHGIMDDETPDAAQARQDWHRAAIRAFFAAAHARPWVDQRISLPAWVAACQPVWAWVVQRNVCPFQDPSWTWANVMERSVLDPVVQNPDWHSLLGAGPLGAGFITPINSLAQWHTMGVLMKNCLKDHRSDHYRDAVLQGNAYLYRLDLNGHSSLFALARDPHNWFVVEHRGFANSNPHQDHQTMALNVARFHTYRLTGRERVGVGRWRSRTAAHRQRLQEQAGDTIDPVVLQALDERVDPRWLASRRRLRWGRLNPLAQVDRWFFAWQNGMATRPGVERWRRVVLVGALAGAASGLISAGVHVVASWL